jgi:hypothetical protein
MFSRSRGALPRRRARILVPSIEIRSPLIGFLICARLATVDNVLRSTTNDPCNEQREPKKNHGTRYGTEKKDLFGGII